MAEACERTMNFQEEQNMPPPPPPPPLPSPSPPQHTSINVLILALIFPMMLRLLQEEQNMPPPPPPPPSLPPPPPSPPPPQHTNSLILALIFPMMFSMLPVKYQGNDTSPFKTHVAEVILSVVSYLIFVFSHIALMKITPDSDTYYEKALQILASVFGPLAVASYLSLLFPSLRPIFYTISILYSAAKLLYNTLTQRLRCLYHKFINISTDTETYTTSQDQLPV